MTAAEQDRFWSHVDIGSLNDCWPWLAFTYEGYGRFTADGRRVVRAHRFAYESAVGPIPAGMDLDHLCRNRACVNPDHLEPVTRGENTRRAVNQFLLRDRCSAGHEYTPDTTYEYRGRRLCKPCRRAAWRRWNSGRAVA